MKHIYLCGPVTGRSRQEALTRFAKAEGEIRRRAVHGNLHISTRNPMQFCPYEYDWHNAMKVCIGELVRCSGIALLQGWQRSKGAAFELRLAQDLRIPVVYVEPPIDSLGLTELFTASREAFRYYERRIDQGSLQGWAESTAEERAVIELANRYLDPQGFDFISGPEGE